MNLYFEIGSPAAREAALAASSYGLQNHGLTRLRRAYWNLSTGALYEESVFRAEGRIARRPTWATGATQRCSSGFPAPARRRCRPILRAT